MMQVSFIENATKQENISAVGAAALLDVEHADDARSCRTGSSAPATAAAMKQRYFATVQYAEARRASAATAAPARISWTRRSSIAGCACGRAGRSLLQRALSRRERPGAAQQPPGHGQRHDARVDRALRHPRGEGRRGAVRRTGSAATRSRPPATCSSPTTRPQRRRLPDAGAACRCSPRAPRSGPSRRRAAPGSTSPRPRFTFRTAGR